MANAANNKGNSVAPLHNRGGKGVTNENLVVDLVEQEGNASSSGAKPPVKKLVSKKTSAAAADLQVTKAKQQLNPASIGNDMEDDIGAVVAVAPAPRRSRRSASAVVNGDDDDVVAVAEEMNRVNYGSDGGGLQGIATANATAGATADEDEDEDDQPVVCVGSKRRRRAAAAVALSDSATANGITVGDEIDDEDTSTPKRSKGSKGKRIPPSKETTATDGATAQTAAVADQDAEIATAAADMDNGEVDDVACLGCSRADGDHAMLLCDGCDAPWHTFCLQPPLKDIPEGGWYCGKCVTAGADKTSDAKKQHQQAVPYKVRLNLLPAGVYGSVSSSWG